MIDRIRLYGITKALKLARWLARPSIRGRKFLTHFEIIAKMTTSQVRRGDANLAAVDKATLFVDGYPVIETPKNELEEEIERITQGEEP